MCNSACDSIVPHLSSCLLSFLTVTYCVVFLCENSSTASIIMGHLQNCHELFMFVLAVDWLAGDIDGVQSLCLLHSFSMHHGQFYTFSMSMLKSFMNNTCRERTLS